MDPLRKEKLFYCNVKLMLMQFLKHNFNLLSFILKIETVI